MKSVTAFAVLLLLLGPTGVAQHVPPGIASDTESQLAEVVIKSDGGRVLVMLDTVLDASDGPDGFTDDWFVLQTHEPPRVADRLSGALVVLTSSSLRVSATSGQRYEFLLPVEDCPATDADTSRSRNVTRIEGFGLAHFRAATKIPLVADAAALASWEWRFLDGEACLSGGPGATQCSTADGRFACATLRPEPLLH